MAPSDQMRKEVNSVHLLLLGRSQEHIHRVVEHYHPAHISLFTSESLLQEADELILKLQNNGISTRLISIDPFHKDAITSVMRAIIKEYEFLRDAYQSPDSLFYIGVTGGTNLMVLGAGFAASHLGLQSHYVLNPDFLEEEGTNLIVDLDISSMNISEPLLE